MPSNSKPATEIIGGYEVRVEEYGRWFVSITGPRTVYGNINWFDLEDIDKLMLYLVNAKAYLQTKPDAVK